MIANIAYESRPSHSMIRAISKNAIATVKPKSRSDDADSASSRARFSRNLIEAALLVSSIKGLLMPVGRCRGTPRLC